MPARTAHLSPAFFRATEQLASEMRARGAKISAIDLLNEWMFESGVGLVRQPRNGSAYYGLNMMSAANVKGIGFPGTAAQYRDLPFEDQVGWIARYYNQMVNSFLGGDWSSVDPVTLYMINFTPAYVRRYVQSGKDPNFLVAPKGSAIANANSAFAGQKGYIVAQDLQNALDRAKRSDPGYWNEIVARAESEGNTAPPSVGGGTAISAALPWIFVLGGLGLLGYGYLQTHKAPRWLPRPVARLAS